VHRVARRADDGRYAIRSGAAQPTESRSGKPRFPRPQPLGYATALSGNGISADSRGKIIRAPTDQGFDEWYGIPLTSNEAQVTTSPGFDSTKTPTPYIWEAKRADLAQSAGLRSREPAHDRSRGGDEASRSSSAT
jgi:arylsulfatase